MDNQELRVLQVRLVKQELMDKRETGDKMEFLGKTEIRAQWVLQEIQDWQVQQERMERRVFQARTEKMGLQVKMDPLVTKDCLV